MKFAKKGITIKSIHREAFDPFFTYLSDHLAHNGKDKDPLFQPMSRGESKVSAKLESNFKVGQSIPTDQAGWRRLWIALNLKEEIVGHIDLRSHNQKHTQHRALLGMGVHRDYRKLGLGSALINTLIEWGKDNTTVEYIDLWVLSNNAPAIGLYRKMGFQKTGEVKDMFRIDNIPYHYTMMAKKLS